jgi:MYXO-CTERM domain-containing protein
MRGFECFFRASGLPSRALAVVAPGLATLCALLPAASTAAVIPGQVVLQTGDTPAAGAGVVDVSPPFVNAAGEVAVLGNLDDGDHYIFIGAATAWLGSDDAALVLTAPALTMDSNGLGNFVYAPNVDGLDGLYTDAGVLVMAGEPAVGYPAGAVYTFLDGASMTADGSIYWVAGVDLEGDGTTDVRAFYYTPDGTAASIVRLLAGGDMVDAFMIDNDPSGIDFSYAVSEDGVHRIHLLNMEGTTTTDGFVWVDGVLVAREADAAGDGTAWQTFDLVGINAGGNHLFSGISTGPLSGNYFLAHNSEVVVREGNVVAGVTLTGPASLRFAAISDFDQAVHAWVYSTPAGVRETVFFACDANDVAGTSQVVFTTIDDELDAGGDGVADYTITDITLTGPTVGRGLGETPFVYAEVALDNGLAITEAMIEVPVSCCGNSALNPFEECDDGNLEETDDCLSTCVAASCGDGFIQDGVEECDDGNSDDTDECPGTCAPAACGDGFVQDGVEECDDGNTEDDEDCLANCTLPSVGSTGGGDTTADTGLDDTAGSSGGGNGSTGPGPVTSAGSEGSSGTETETETDTDSGGATGGDEGCSCRTAEPRLPGLSWLGLGLLGLLRRRRR